jgi:aryl-alcohol dehydrogenase-like predicted oxidoreductase
MKNSSMKRRGLNRRQFIQNSVLLAGTAWLSPWTLSSVRAAAAPGAAPAGKRTAVDQVTLGKTGIKLSRLGFGTGSNNGREQTDLGKESFTKLIHYAYDQGITYIDTSESYRTFEWISGAVKGLPREKLFIQSKMDGKPDNVLAVIDHHRKVFNTDYIDSLLVHCMTRGQWTDEWKRIMDGFNEARDKKWISAKGVSCHSLPAMRGTAASDWAEVLLTRVNPQGIYTDGEVADWSNNIHHDIAPVMSEIKTMHAKGVGVIGMKILGAGTFTEAADREKSIRFAMACRDIDAVVIGFTSTKQIDEAIERMNRALAEV